GCDRRAGPHRGHRHHLPGPGPSGPEQSGPAPRHRAADPCAAGRAHADGGAMNRTTTLVSTKQSLRRHRAALEGTVAVVMTMGALHDGHLSLVERARQVADHVILTDFVNPLQFSPGADFEAYPRDLDADLDQVEGLVDLVFAPDTRERYPARPPTVSVSAGRAGPGARARRRPPALCSSPTSSPPSSPAPGRTSRPTRVTPTRTSTRSRDGSTWSSPPTPARCTRRGRPPSPSARAGPAPSWRVPLAPATSTVWSRWSPNCCCSPPRTSPCSAARTPSSWRSSSGSSPISTCPCGSRRSTSSASPRAWPAPAATHTCPRPAATGRWP